MTSNGRKATIESHLPGRMRVRLPPSQRHERCLEQVKSAFESMNGVRSVFINPVTGGVLVEYDPDAVATRKLVDMGVAAGVIGEVGDLVSSGLIQLPWPGTSAAARNIMSGIRAFDTTVNRISRGVVDGKVAVSLLLLTFSLGRAFLSQRRSPAPWHSLMWYSYSLFMHWHNPTRGSTRTID